MSEYAELVNWLLERAKGIRRRKPHPPIADAERLESSASAILALEAQVEEMREALIEIRDLPSREWYQAAGVVVNALATVNKLKSAHEKGPEGP